MPLVYALLLQRQSALIGDNMYCKLLEVEAGSRGGGGVAMDEPQY
jgi:hypothetical protein